MSELSFKEVCIDKAERKCLSLREDDYNDEEIIGESDFLFNLQLINSPRIDEATKGALYLIECIKNEEYYLFNAEECTEHFIDVIEVAYASTPAKHVPQTFFYLLYIISKESNLYYLFTPELIGCIISLYKEISSDLTNVKLALKIITNLINTNHEVINTIDFGEFSSVLFEHVHMLNESASDTESEEVSNCRENILLCISSFIRKLFRNIEEYHDLFLQFINCCRECLNNCTLPSRISCFEALSSVIIKETPDDACFTIIENFSMDIVAALDNESDSKCRKYIFKTLTYFAYSHENVLKTFCYFLAKETNPDPIHEFVILLATLCNCESMEILISVTKSPWFQTIINISDSIPFKEKELTVSSITGLINTKEKMIIESIISEDIIMFIPHTIDGLPQNLIKAGLQSLCIIKDYLEETGNDLLSVFSDSDFVDAIVDLDPESGYLKELIEKIVPTDDED